MLRNLKSILSTNILQRRLQTRTLSSSIVRNPPFTGSSISNESSNSNFTSPPLVRELQQHPMKRIARRYSMDRSDEVNQINMKFAEARDDIESALESKETVYFNEEAECARDSVKQVLDMFEALLEKLPEGERGALRRSMGLKMEQLKAELEQLND